MLSDDEDRRERRRKKIAEAEYDVGFGKTSTQTRFQKGKSGNPNGRPKGAKGVSTLVRDAAEAPVEYIENGKKKKGSSLGVGLKRLGRKAAQGDTKATIELTKLYQMHGPPPEPEDELDPVADEAAYWEFVDHIRQMRSQ